MMTKTSKLQVNYDPKLHSHCLHILRHCQPFTGRQTTARGKMRQMQNPIRRTQTHRYIRQNICKITVPRSRPLCARRLGTMVRPVQNDGPAYTASAAKFNGNIRFLNLNSEQYPNAATRLNIKGIPALFFFNHGKLISQQSGALPETNITQWIKADSSA